MSTSVKTEINQPGNFTAVASAFVQKRKCDHCEKADAHTYCRADGAFLCYKCDDTIHSANKLAMRHERISVADAIAEGLGDQGEMSNSEGSQTQLPSKQPSQSALKSESDDMNRKPGDSILCKVEKDPKNSLVSQSTECNTGNRVDANGSAPKVFNAPNGGMQYFVPKEECAENGNGSGSIAEAQGGDVSITPPMYNQQVHHSFPVNSLGVRRNMSMDDVSNFRGNSGAASHPGMAPSNGTVHNTAPEFNPNGYMNTAHSVMMAPSMYSSSHIPFGAHSKLKHCLGPAVLSEQRLSKVHRYKQKRQARLIVETSGHKKIRYACRKTLADSRPRVKGRFAKVHTNSTSASVTSSKQTSSNRSAGSARPSKDTSKSAEDQSRSDELFFVPELVDMDSEEQKLEDDLQSGFAADSDDVFQDLFSADLGADEIGMSKAAMRRVMSSPAFLDLGDVVL